MKTESARIANKIKALFAKLKDDATTDAEKAAAEAKANELIIKYAIEESMLAEVDRDAIVTESIWLEGAGGPRIARLRSLAYNVAVPHGVYMYYTGDCWKPDGTTRAYSDGKKYPNYVTHTSGRRKGLYKKYTRLNFVGKAGAVAGVKVLASSMINLALAGSSKVTISPDDGDYFPWDSKAANTKRVRLAYIEGFTVEVNRRLKELNRITDEKHGNSLLPVLRSDVERAKASITGLGRGSSFRRSSAPSARAAGTAAGSSANLAGGSMPSARKALSA